MQKDLNTKYTNLAARLGDIEFKMQTLKVAKRQVLEAIAALQNVLSMEQQNEAQTNKAPASEA